MKCIKKITIVGMLVLLVAVLAISVSARYQIGNNSQTISPYTISGYLYTQSSSTVGADTVTSSGLSSNGVYSITARVVGSPGVTRSYTNYPGYVSVTATGAGDSSAFGSHSATSSVGSFGFNTPY